MTTSAWVVSGYHHEEIPIASANFTHSIHLQRKAADRQERLDHAQCEVAGLRQAVSELQKQLTAASAQAAAAQQQAHVREGSVSPGVEQPDSIAAQFCSVQDEAKV